jgi:recombinational DNA repair protein RecR
MKHLSIRPSAQTHTAPALASALVQFTAKKMNKVITLPQRVKGQWRLYLNYCPECNSCAPKTKCCDVCNSDTRAFFHWTDDIRNSWWKKYAEKHRIAI